jgi:predicted transposase/invertase (TIGR01784 family)
MLEAKDDILGHYMLSREMGEIDERSRLYSVREEGREEGIEIGIEKGRAETIIEKNREFVLRMFNRNYDIATISDLTGLSLEKVQAIIDSVTN